MNTDLFTRWYFLGLSSETKPTPELDKRVVNGSTFFEADTSRLFIWYKSQWYRKTSDVQSKLDGSGNIIPNVINIKYSLINKNGAVISGLNNYEWCFYAE